MLFDLYYFNPDNEMSIAQGSENYTLPASILRMGDELSYLPAYYAAEGSFILTDDLPDRAFLEERKVLFGIDNRPIRLQEAKEKNWNRIIPWGWSPRIKGLFKSMNVVDRTGMEQIWDQKQKELYSRKNTAPFLEKLRGRMGLSEDILPKVCTTVDEVELLSRHSDSVVKAPWSSSGRGILMLEKGRINDTNKKWLSGVLNKQKYVLVEKRLNKLLDFALEYRLDQRFSSRAVTYLGISLFSTGERGEYRGNILQKQSESEAQLMKYIDRSAFLKLQSAVASVLEELYVGRYQGPLGIDMMIYRDEEGHSCLQPCIEINLRYNMGILSIALSEHLAQGSSGIFNLTFNPGAGEAYAQSEHYRQLYPIVLNGGKISSGFIPLTPVKKDTGFMAYMIVN